MPEVEDIIGKRIVYLWLNELREMDRGKSKAQYVNAFHSFITICRGIQSTQVAFTVFFTTINISCKTEFQFKIISCRVCPLVMVHQYACIFNIPLCMTM